MEILTKEHIEVIAKDAGFLKVGFSRAALLDKEISALNYWNRKGFSADMEYMRRNVSLRENVRELFPEASSVISLAVGYSKKAETSERKKGKVSVYAWGRDYHFIVTEMCLDLISGIRKIDEGFNALINVDTKPVMDKAWAVRSGIGWQGKNSNIINREFGSFFFLATIICNREFQYSEQSPDFCGTCTRCIDACPTGAITEPYFIDSRRCISYLTIENKEEISEEFRGKFQDMIFGCDICQDVCPWNKNAFKAVNALFSDTTNDSFEIDCFNDMSSGEFKRMFKGSPILRAKLKGMQRNCNFIKNK